MTTFQLTLKSMDEEKATAAAKETEAERRAFIDECEDGVDELVDETFPASDPPSHGGCTPH